MPLVCFYLDPDVYVEESSNHLNKTQMRQYDEKIIEGGSNRKDVQCLTYTILFTFIGL